MKMLISATIALVVLIGCTTTQKPQKELSYLDWQPVLQPEEIFKSQIGFGYVQTEGDNAYWLESSAPRDSSLRPLNWRAQIFFFLIILPNLS